MANASDNTLFCFNLGNTSALGSQSCCYLDHQNDSVCDEAFGIGGGGNQNSLDQGFSLYHGFIGFQEPDPISQCQNPTRLYASVQQNYVDADGEGPIQRFTTCANLPDIISYSSQKLLSPGISNSIANITSQNSTNSTLANIINTVTSCLIATCSAARNTSVCSNQCSAPNLLSSSTSLNLPGINDCLNALCHNPSSWPYADMDVVGIGVFASYIMQCLFVFFLFLATALLFRPRTVPEETNLPGVETPRRRYLDLLLDFHKAQCYFSGTLMIASLAYGIFDMNMLVTFMLIPLATNGILPILFTYVLLLWYKESATGITLLTLTCYILSTIVGVTLYSHIAMIDQPGFSPYHAIQQYRYKLSAMGECGGYSGLAVCPNSLTQGVREPMLDAEHHLRVIPPLIWVFSTGCLLALLAFQLYKWRVNGKKHKESTGWTEKKQRLLTWAFWLTTLIFVVGLGLQLSLLQIALELKMMDLHYWGFGQIIAVTIWAPPIVEWAYKASKDFVNRKKRERDERRKIPESMEGEEAQPLSAGVNDENLETKERRDAQLESGQRPA